MLQKEAAFRVSSWSKWQRSITRCVSRKEGEEQNPVEEAIPQQDQVSTTDLDGEVCFRKNSATP